MHTRGIKMFNRVASSENISFILSASRVHAGKTQKYMAQSLGKSIGTIQNWEAGIGAPNVVDMIEWFDILGLNPMRYLLDFFFPDIYMGKNAQSPDEDVRKAVINYFENVATDSEVRKVAFCIFGNTGSSWPAQLEMLTAHNHTTLKSRVNAAQMILDSYDMEKARGELVRTDHILPNEDVLNHAIKSGKRSVLEGKPGYAK